MVFQYTGALPSSNMAHEGSVNLKGSQILNNMITIQLLKEEAKKYFDSNRNTVGHDNNMLFN